MSIARLMQMGAAGVGAEAATAVFVGSAGDTSNQTTSGTRSYSITHDCDPNVSYIILLGNSSGTNNYNKINNCTVNSVSATAILQSGTATSYTSKIDRNSAAIFIVSGITGSSISISTDWTGSNVFRSSAQVYKANKILTLNDTAVDTGSVTDTSGSINIDVDTNGFVVAFSNGVSASANPTFNGDVSDDDINVVETYLTALCGYKKGGGAAYQIDGTNLTDGNASTSFRMLAASFGNTNTVAPSWTDPDIANASYDSVSFDLTTQDSLPFEIRFNNDGTKMYMVGNSNDSVYEYALSTAYDVSTASYNSASLSVTSQDTVPVGLFFKSDGTKMYVNGIGNDAIFQYSLSTAWDLSTASYDSVSFSVSSQDGIPYTSFFKPDGTKFYVIGLDTDNVFQYSLSTAWDLSTASYDSVSFNVTTQTTTPISVYFNPDGDKMYISDVGADDVFQYSLSTAWDVSSASYDSVSFDASTQVSNASSLEFKPDGSKMYITDNTNGIVYQYST